MENYPRCETCKHWSDEDIYERTFPHRPGFGECDIWDSGYVATPNDYPLAYYDPLDSYAGGGFKTSPDFGCLAHEPKVTD